VVGASAAAAGPVAELVWSELIPDHLLSSPISSHGVCVCERASPLAAAVRPFSFVGSSLSLSLSL
jgi:hypothetical protein